MPGRGKSYQQAMHCGDFGHQYMQKLYLSLVFSILATPFLEAATINLEKHKESEGGPRSWAYEIGAAFITPNNISDFGGMGHGVSRAQGDAGGEIYSFTASRRLGQLVWNIAGYTFTPQMELPFTLEVVHENSGTPFLACAGSFSMRWVDFPWHDYVRTSFAMGLGLNLSSKIYKMDQERHEDTHRSHLKFNWPIQATFALPSHPRDQLLVYIIHHSGGHVFDQGGLNALWIGYRRDF